MGHGAKIATSPDVREKVPLIVFIWFALALCSLPFALCGRQPHVLCPLPISVHSTPKYALYKTFGEAVYLNLRI